jgi:hypothetical protein
MVLSRALRWVSARTPAFRSSQSTSSAHLLSNDNRRRQRSISIFESLIWRRRFIAVWSVFALIIVLHLFSALHQVGFLVMHCEKFDFSKEAGV